MTDPLPNLFERFDSIDSPPQRRADPSPGPYKTTGNIILAATGEFIAKTLPPLGTDGGEIEAANLQLLAASWELLRAARSARRGLMNHAGLTTDCPGCQALRELSAAIDKATGVQS